MYIICTCFKCTLGRFADSVTAATAGTRSCGCPDDNWLRWSGGVNGNTDYYGSHLCLFQVIPSIY